MTGLGYQNRDESSSARKDRHHARGCKSPNLACRSIGHLDRTPACVRKKTTIRSFRKQDRACDDQCEIPVGDEFDRWFACASAPFPRLDLAK